MGKQHAFHASRWNGLIAAGALALAANTTNAVESTTDIFVSKVAVISGNPGTGPKLSYLSMPLVRPVLYSGKITSLGTGSITDTNATWIQSQFNGTNGLHYVEFDSGVTADITQTQAATDTLVHAGTLTGLITVGNSFRVRRHATLSDIFGQNNEAGLLAGANSAVADNVLVHDPTTQVTMTFFYSSVSGFTGWYRDNFTPASTLAVYPEQGLMVRRRASGNLSVYLNGAAKEGPTRVPVYAGYNLVGTLKGTKNMMLSELNLYTGNAATGIQAGSSLTTADNLMVVRPDSTTISYFYSNLSGNVGWYDASYSSASNAIVSAGSAFFINRKSSSGLFHWYIPAE